jgi:cytochrome c oxidase cbb3-type subunit III
MFSCEIPGRVTSRYHRILAVWVCVLMLGLAACEREERRFREKPPAATPVKIVTQSDLQPGPAVPRVEGKNRAEENAYDVAQGKRLYEWFNCVGCHSHGGGGMGPPLMDDQWIYGSAPENIFATIVEGRPNGMPAFGHKLSTQEVWQLVAYVRSLSGQVRKDVAGGRSDHMNVKESEQSTEREEPKQASLPPAAEQP